MFKFIENFIEKRKRIWRFKSHKDGYAWAAVKLLKGESTYNVLNYVHAAKDFDAYGEFDRGIEDAVRDYKVIINKNSVKDNTVSVSNRVVDNLVRR